jgi:uncharacterized protein YkwD
MRITDRELPRRTLIAVIAVSLLAVPFVAVALAAPAEARAGELLAPKSKCEGQTQLRRPASEQERAMRCLINYARRKSGHRPLDPTPKLGRSADLKASDILGCQDYDHHACGRDPFYFLRVVEYLIGCAGAGENLYWGPGGYGTARFTMRQWLGSQSHREAMLRGRYRDMGVGVRDGTMQGESGSQVWVAHFGYHC